MGSKGGGSSAPASPDPYATADAQWQANQKALTTSSTLNAIDTYGPTGSVTYARRPDGTPYAMTTSLTPTGQDIFDTQQLTGKDLTAQAYNMAGNLPSGLDYSGLNYDPNSYGNLDLYNKSMADSVYNRELSYLQPQFDTQNKQLQNQLIQQGFEPGNEAYETAMSKMRDDQNQAYLAAANDATQAGETAARNQITTEQGLRSNAINEQKGAQDQYLSQLMSYLTGTSVQSPSAQTGTSALNAQAPDVEGAIYNSYNGAMNAYNTQQNQRAATMGSLAGLAGSIGSALILSDEDQKEDIEDADYGTPVLDALKHLPMSEWQYKETSPAYDGGKRHVGPMAQDMKAVFGIGTGRVIPTGVPTDGSYPDAFGLTLAAVKELSRKVDNQKARRA